MPEIKYSSVSELLRQPEDEWIYPVYLLYGEEYLYKDAFDKLLNLLVPKEKQSLNYESVDTLDNAVSEAVERLNTFSFSPGKKVIALTDSNVFYSKQNDQDLFLKARDAWEQDSPVKAANFLVNLLALKNMSIEDATAKSLVEELTDSGGSGDEDKWLMPLIDYCRQNNVKKKGGQDQATVLENAIVKGFCKQNHLIVTAEVIDKRRKLFEAFKSNGLVIDCHVPKGERKADKDAQQAVLNQQIKTILAKYKKTIEPKAFNAMLDLIGFDLRTFANSIEKLVQYIGNRQRITLGDVTDVLNRTKVDPIFEMTNAVADKDTLKALNLVGSLLSGDIFPLQIIAALTNQIRKLLMVVDFLESPQGQTYQTGMSYSIFQKQVVPAIVDYDATLKNELETWNDILTEAESSSRKTAKIDTDLFLLKNPKNAYPVFQQFAKSKKFSKTKLMDAMQTLYEADVKLKSSGIAPKLILDQVILKICQ